MGSIPSPDDVEPGTVLPLDVFSTLLRCWRNHWAEVERIARDCPEDVKMKTLLRPVDPEEALAQTRAQFAVLFHPEAISAFVSYLNAGIATVDELIKREGSSCEAADLRRDPEVERMDDVLVRLEERVGRLDLRVAKLLDRSRDGD